MAAGSIAREGGLSGKRRILRAALVARPGGGAVGTGVNAIIRSEEEGAYTFI
jgi:hypothetical protein